MHSSTVTHCSSSSGCAVPEARQLVQLCCGLNLPGGGSGGRGGSPQRASAGLHGTVAEYVLQSMVAVP